MIDASLPVQKAIRARLIADATVNALIAGRIYDAVPTSAVKPYLSFGPFDVLPELADCSEGAEITLQIDGWAKGPDTVEAKRIGAAVSRALHSAEMPLDEEQRLVLMQVETVRYLRDPDGITAHTAVSVRALTEPIVILDPTIRLTGSSVPENAAIGAKVGTLSMTGVFTGTPVYTLVDNAGGRFALDGADVEVAGALDFEAATSHAIIVAVSGITPVGANKTFTISVTNVDDTAPLITSVATRNNAEGTVLAHSLTANEAVTWTILAGLDAAHFEISGSTLRWLGNGTKDYEAPGDTNLDNVYQVQVRATDTAGNPSLPQTISIAVTNVAETVGDISLTGSTVAENAAIGTTVGTLSITGTTGTPTFTLTDSAGGRFSITGTSLKVAAALDFETGASHLVTVAVTGVTPPTASETFTITVTDIDEIAPVITSPASANNLENTVLAFALTADEPVTWTKVGGADASHFVLTGSTLSWASGTKDYETPGSSLGTNAYVVQVRATDLAGNVSPVKTITINVTDVVETPATNGTPIGLLLALTHSSGTTGTTAGVPTGLLLSLTKAT